jgi:hypothetical protein
VSFLEFNITFSSLLSLTEASASFSVFSIASLVSTSEEFTLIIVPAAHLTFAVSVGHAPDSLLFITFLDGLINGLFGIINGLLKIFFGFTWFSVS